ncbi:DUF1328 domain-containing protein [Frateuria soli]|uniref:DUF1328 domain-containing protein n=1 Tax=Frateuria soli TaxID=1542730 RepID=UPI003CCD8904
MRQDACRGALNARPCEFLRSAFTGAPVGWPLDAAVSSHCAAIAALRTKSSREKPVLTWAIILAIVSLIAGWLGFGTLSGIAGSIAKILFVIFVILFVLALLGVLGVLSIF